MSEVCAKHVKTPAFIYGACIGCELEGLRDEAQALREEVAALRAKLSDLPGWLRSIYEWGYVGGQNNPNGYIDEEDRDKWVNDILVRNHISP